MSYVQECISSLPGHIPASLPEFVSHIPALTVALCIKVLKLLHASTVCLIAFLYEIRLHNLVETFYDLIKFQPNPISLVKWLISLHKSACKLFYKKHKKDLCTSPLSVCMLRAATASSPSPLCLCVPRMASEY